MKSLTWFFKPSLKREILTAFIITAIIPVLIISIFSYINTYSIVRENAEELIQTNIEQTKSSLDVWVDSYEDILFQIYMNDEIVDMTEKICTTYDDSLIKSQLRRSLRGMFYTKEHIKCITVITASGEVIFYDLLTGSATHTSWIGTMGMNEDELYEYLSQDNGTRILSTKRAGEYASETYYLFHLGHRIIDYQNVDKEIGVVIVSVDESMFQEIYGESPNNYTFMVDNKGTMISCYDKSWLGEQVINWSEDVKVREQEYLNFLKNHNLAKYQSGTISILYDEEFQADIVNVSNQEELLAKLKSQQQFMIWVIVITAIALAICIFFMTRNFMKTINRLVTSMKTAGKGKLSVRTEVDKKTPSEIQSIVEQFNHMMDKLEDSAEKEKIANERQREAQIAALEAQINPHFLYNTLDTINWMAIDKDEYEISNSITALASILRYGIDNSNGVVSVSREVEWLKQYLFLQQTRLKNTFECEIDVAQEVLDCQIHKLLFQPFIENSILHGFESKKGVHILRISIKPDGESLRITIWDNGKGMPMDILDRINQGNYEDDQVKSHIGMKNAIGRIRMYYGVAAHVWIDSILGEFTCVQICIPKVRGLL